MKRLVSLLLTLTLMLSLGVPAMAANEAPAVGVNLNGANITFTDAAPEITDNRTMVPYRALMEALGGEVDYRAEDRTVLCLLNGAELRFRIGEDTVTVVKGETTETVQMDTVCYLKNDRTYVPVRFFAQAFGYDVMWDAQARCAVLADRAAVIESIDSQFTLLNGALAQQPKLDSQKNYRVKLNGALEVKLEVEGAKYNSVMTVAADMLSGQGVAEGTLTADLSRMIPAELMEEDASVAEAVALLKNLTMDLRADLATGKLYVKNSLLDAMLKQEAGTWYLVNLEELGYTAEMRAELAEAMNKNDGVSTVGAALYETCYELAKQGGIAPSQLCSQAIAVGSLLSAVLGDGNAKVSGKTVSWDFDKEKWNAILGSESGDELFQSLDCRLSMTAGGKTELVVKADMESMAVDCRASGTATDAEFALTMGLGDQGTILLNGRMTLTETTAQPKAVPGEGETVMDITGIFQDMMGGLGYIELPVAE